MKATLLVLAAATIYVLAVRDDTHRLHDELFNSFSFEAPPRASNCDSLVDYFIVKDSGKWTTVRSLAGENDGYDGKKKMIEDRMSEIIAKEGNMGYSWFMDSNPYYMYEMNWGGLVKGWAKFYREKMEGKRNYGTVFVNCDAKLNKQSRDVPNTEAHMRYCNSILHFFRIALLWLGLEPNLYVLYGRHASLFKATYDKTMMEKTISDIIKKNQRLHEYGFNWVDVGFDERGSDMTGAMVYFAGGNLHDLMGLVSSMELEDPAENFKEKVKKFKTLFWSSIVDGWRSKRLMLGGHSAGVMWQSPKNSLNFLYFGMSGDPGTGSVDYQHTSLEGNGDELLCGSADEQPKRNPGNFGSYTCDELFTLQVGGTAAAPSCKPQVWQKCNKGEQLSVNLTINDKSYMIVKPTERVENIEPNSKRWSAPYPNKNEGRFGKTNGLMHWAFRPHCCDSPTEKSPEKDKTVKSHCVDHIPAVLAMFNDGQYVDDMAPIVFTTEGQALQVDPTAAKEKFKLFDAHVDSGVQPLCVETPSYNDWEKCISPPRSWYEV